MAGLVLSGMGDLMFKSEFRLVFFFFCGKCIFFSNSRLISSLPFFFPLPVPIPVLLKKHYCKHIASAYNNNLSSLSDNLNLLVCFSPPRLRGSRESLDYLSRPAACPLTPGPQYSGAVIPSRSE